MNYRRVFVPGASYFFTLTLQDNAMLDFFYSTPTFRGLSAESSDAGRFLDPADKPRDVGS